MPWRVEKRNRGYCVVKSKTGKIVPGGCHSSKKKALAHQRALYANTKE